MLAMWLGTGCLLASCSALLAPSTPTPSPAVPVTGQPFPAIEVTRIVTREVIVTATPAPPTACAPTTTDAAGEIVIGLLAPLSQNAVWPNALAMQAGISIALDDINAAGGIQGKPLRVVTYDTAGQPELAARLAERLITQECAIGLIGGFLEAPSAAIKGVTERYGMPFIVAQAMADELTADRPQALFRVAPAASMIAQMPSHWLKAVGDFNGDGATVAVLIAENSAAGDQAVAQADQWFPADGIAHEALRVDLPAGDFSPQIARIAAMENAPDAILLYLAGDAALALQRQLLDAGIGPQKGTLLVTGRSALDRPNFWEQIPDGQHTVVGRHGPWGTNLTSVGQGFVEKYRKYASQWPDAAAFSAYDAVRLLADAAGRAPSLSSTDLIAALETTDLELAAGHYSFPYNSQQPPDGELTPAYLWHQWPDPPLLYLQYREAQQDPATLDIIWPPLYRTTDGPVLRP